MLIWLELTEPTLENLHTAIDGHLVRGVRYRHLVGATRYGNLFLLDSLEDPLPLSEMIVLYDDTQIRIWWRQCPPTEPMDLLFGRHSHIESEPGTPAPFAYAYGGRDNGDEPNPNTIASEKPEDQLESDCADDSNGGQPQWSATAANRWAPQEPQTPRTLPTYGTAHTSCTTKASTRAPQRP